MDRRAIAVDPETGIVEFKPYNYTPSLAAAAISVAAFATLTALHTWRVHEYRAFYFTAFTIGGLCTNLRICAYLDDLVTDLVCLLVQTIGYGGRLWSHFDQDALGGFIINPRNPYPHRPSSLRCFHLHGPRPASPFSSGRAPFLCPIQVDDQDFRHR